MPIEALLRWCHEKSRQHQLITGFSKESCGNRRNISGGFPKGIHGGYMGETFRKIGK